MGTVIGFAGSPRTDRRPRRLIAASVIAVQLGLSGCGADQQSETPPVDALILRHKTVAVMGTELDVEVLGYDPRQLELGIDAVVAEVQRIESLLTSWRPSALTRLVDDAGNGPQKVDKEVADLIDRAVAIGKLAGGAFDIAHPAVGELWESARAEQKLPDDAAIERARARVGSDRIVVDLDAGTVELPAGMKINLDGLMKGYALDRAIALLIELGVKNAAVRIGNDVKLLGTKGSESWQVEIVHPRDKRRVIAVLDLRDTCIATSGDFSRFFEVDGKRYHHVLDPRTGRPSEGCMSATIVAASAEGADALATAVCVIGPEEGMKLVQGMPRVEAILVDMDGEVRVSPGLRQFLK